MSRAHSTALVLALRLGLLVGVGLGPAAGPVWAGPARAAAPAAPAAPSATIVVTTTADEFNTNPGACSLREAIEAARLDAAFGGCTAGSGVDLISLSVLTYTLSIAADASPNDNADGDLDIASPLTITVPSPAGAVIQQTAGDRVMHVISGTVVGLHRVTLTGGVTALFGGGLLADAAGAHLTLLDTGLVSNTAGVGGGLLVDGATVTATRSAFISNTANLASGGGGIFLDSGDLRLVNTSLIGNRATAGPAGGLRQLTGAAQLSSVSVVSNSATSSGGGLYVDAGTLNFKNTVLGDNTAPAGPDCDGSLTSGDYNLIENATDCTVTGTTTNNLSGAPGLGPLETIYGRTPARVPLPGSPALDAANPGGCTDHLSAALTNDQRLQSRPEDGDGTGGARCDMGAAEAQPNLLQVNSPGVHEDEGVMSVTLSRILGDGPVSASFSTSNGSAVAGADFAATAGAVAWAAGDFTPRVITATLVNDAVPEGDEALTVVFTPTGVLESLASLTHTVRLFDDEAAGMLQVAVPQVAAREGDGSAQVWVMRANGHTGAVSVNYAIAGGGGQGAGGGTLNWADGDAFPRLIEVPLTNDGAAESGETLTVTLSSPGGGAGLLGQTQAVVRVLDDDATGATLNVNTTADELNSDGDCSLREAVRAANLDLAVDACPAGAGADTIVLAAATYLLTVAGANENAAMTGDLDLNDDVTIRGQGAAATVVSGGGLDRVFHAGASNASVLVTLRGLTVREGDASANGAGVFSLGQLVLQDTILTDNDSDGFGGGLAAQGPTLAAGVVFSQNSAGGGGAIYLGSETAASLWAVTIVSNTSDSGDGGGVYAAGAYLTLSGSSVADNVSTANGGGLHLHDGAAALLNTNLTGNRASAGGNGGGLYSAGMLLLVAGEVSGNEAGVGGGVYLNASQAAAVIVGADLSGNTGGGGVAARIPLVLADSVVSGNAGNTLGGVQGLDRAWLWRTAITGNDSDNNGGGVLTNDRAWIGQSLIGGNTALTGAGLHATRRVDLVNVTLSGNTATTAGGGVASVSNGEVRLRNVTVAGNSAPTGGGLHTNASAGQIYVINTLLAGSLSGGNCGGSGVTSGGDNLSTDGTCLLVQTGDANNTPAGLGPLAANGGPTLTHALAAGSAARDTGNPAVCPAHDQRGFARASAAPCDLGAFEFAAIGPRLWLAVIRK